MSNREDWPEVVSEVFDIWRERFETELHNAFVAGLEQNPDVAIDVKALQEVAKRLKAYQLERYKFSGLPCIEWLFDRGVEIEKALKTNGP